MSASSAIGLAEQFLYQQLSGDGALAALVGSRIYADQMPEGATYPAVVYQLYNSRDALGSGFSRYLTNTWYIVRAADRVASKAGLDAIMRRVDQLLHGQANVQLTNGAMLGCQRERPIQAPPGVVAGVATREIAFMYLVVVQEAS